MNAHDLGDYFKSYLSQIGLIKRKKTKKEEEEEEEEEEDLEFALIDRREAPVKIYFSITVEPAIWAETRQNSLKPAEI